MMQIGNYVIMIELQLSCTIGMRAGSSDRSYPVLKVHNSSIGDNFLAYLEQPFA